MSKNVFVEADSFRRLLLGAAGGYELQGYHEAAQTVMHVIDALDELTTGGKGRSQEDEDRDDYRIPEGWWEYRHFNPDDVYNNKIDCTVVGWMPLPPKEVTQNGNQ